MDLDKRNLPWHTTSGEVHSPAIHVTLADPVAFEKIYPNSQEYVTVVPLLVLLESVNACDRSGTGGHRFAEGITINKNIIAL